MKKWMALALVLGLGVATLGTVAYAQERGMGMGRAEARAHGFMQAGGFSRMGGFHGRGEMGRRLLALLDNPRFKQSLSLTDEQSGQLRKIIVGAEEASIKTRAEMAVSGIELRELLRADHPDREAVMKEADQISALRSQMMKQRLDALLAAKNILTPEQQARMRSFLERRAAGGRFMHQRFGERRGSMPGMLEGGAATTPHPPVPPNQ
jgi:Spy/CpxP family protein refolding chaperone